MALAQIPVLLTQKPSTENGINRATTLFLAWTLILRVVSRMALPPPTAPRTGQGWTLSQRGHESAYSL